jgi:glutamate 5-kinase
VLLSDVDGFYSANPKEDPTARRFDTVSRITPAIEAMAGDPVSGFSKGGMKTKIMAAKTATGGGCAMAITLGITDRPLTALAEGAPATWFLPETDPHVARKRWIGGMKPKGEITVDAGAAAALGKGKSLLPAGVTAGRGRFGRGDPVAILGPAGDRLGIGLTRYTARTRRRLIRGRHTGRDRGDPRLPGPRRAHPPRRHGALTMGLHLGPNTHSPAAATVRG